MGPSSIRGAQSLAPQIEGNGLELWRKLHGEYEGCDELIRMAGRQKLHGFKQCTAMRNLNSALDEWIDLFRTDKFYRLCVGILRYFGRAELVQL